MEPTDLDATTEGSPGSPWLTPGVRGIGVGSLLSDLVHEVPSAFLPAFLASTLGAPPPVLGLIVHRPGHTDGTPDAHYTEDP